MKPKRSKQKLKGIVVPVGELQVDQQRRMYELMCEYYEKVEWSSFESDLQKKSKIILLITGKNKIHGFSTLQRVEVQSGGKHHYGMFSGDTVLEREFWGTRVLGKVFLRELFFEKLRRPFQPLYWLLMSKGYKTYLLMANNFAAHYPRYEEQTPPAIKDIQDAFYQQIYPKNYNAQTGLITFDGKSMHLKPTVAPISKDVSISRRVQFFEEKNPNWSFGNELACMAEMTLDMPFKYILKAIYKSGFFKRFRGQVKISSQEMEA